MREAVRGVRPHRRGVPPRARRGAAVVGPLRPRTARRRRRKRVLPPQRHLSPRIGAISLDAHTPRTAQHQWRCHRYARCCAFRLRHFSPTPCKNTRTVSVRNCSCRRDCYARNFVLGFLLLLRCHAMNSKRTRPQPSAAAREFRWGSRCFYNFFVPRVRTDFLNRCLFHTRWRLRAHAICSRTNTTDAHADWESLIHDQFDNIIDFSLIKLIVQTADAKSFHLASRWRNCALIVLFAAMGTICIYLQ